MYNDVGRIESYNMKAVPMQKQDGTGRQSKAIHNRLRANGESGLCDTHLYVDDGCHGWRMFGETGIRQATAIACVGRGRHDRVVCIEQNSQLNTRARMPL